MVRPGSAAAQVAESLEAALEQYPILDDDKYALMQWEEAAVIWRNSSTADKRRWCQKFGLETRNTPRRVNIPTEKPELLSYLVED